MQINIYSEGFHIRSWRKKTDSYSGPYFHLFKIHKPMRCDGFSMELQHHFSISLENIYYYQAIRKSL